MSNSKPEQARPLKRVESALLRRMQLIDDETPDPIPKSSSKLNNKEVYYNQIHINTYDDKMGVPQEEKEVCQNLNECLITREKYRTSPDIKTDIPKLKNIKLEMNDNGIVIAKTNEGPISNPIPAGIFFNDLYRLWKICKSGPSKTYCFRRLKILEKKFEFHELLNWQLEDAGTTDDPLDFHTIYKVDNHIHLAAAMTSTHLLEFMARKKKECSKEIVLENDVTLGQVFSQVDSLSMDALGTMAGPHRMFHRFDFFNEAYSPFRDTRFRTIFLKPDNIQKGKYFAELSKEVFDRTNHQNKRLLMEPRVSIYGRQRDEWHKLAAWVINNKLHNPRIAWVVQLPRIYSRIRSDSKNKVNSFKDYLNNIWLPIMEVTVDPSKDPILAEFLDICVAFDSVDDESPNDELAPCKISEGHLLGDNYLHPNKWTGTNNPPYSYHLYFLYANLHIFNTLRLLSGKSTMKLRPHAGEAGPVHHLATTFLLADDISHGVRLTHNPTLYYLYFLSQIGLSISPLSNNVLFLELADNPFKQMFKCGLNVTLSTDDPLLFHTTQEPLTEEYTIARQFWKLSIVDLSEIALHSVLQSGFSKKRKEEMIGKYTGLHCGHFYNNLSLTNIPDMRIHFRYHQWLEEKQQIENNVKISKTYNLNSSVSALERVKYARVELRGQSVPEGWEENNEENNNNKK